MSARGVLYLHSCPPAVVPHVEWAVSSVLGGRVSLSWTAQPASPSCLRAESRWQGRAGTAGRLATALRAWPMLRFEVTEDASPGCDGERISYVPGRGIFRTATNACGDIMVSEDRLRAVLATAVGPEALPLAIERLLGAEWDAELEPYRQAGEGAQVTWLHQVV